ncbi:MAG: hypothetical protein KF906_07105 [Actinobacteria bacterium]|nr:hypothetical protein [Actinomycetota bacterium]
MRRTIRGRFGRTTLVGVVALTFVLAGCGDDSDTSGSADATDTGSQDTTASDDAGGSSGSSTGSGSATLTIGDETWTFDNVMCAEGTDETQSEDWDFSLLATSDEMRMNVDRGAEGGPYGDTVHVASTDDLADPSIEWEAPGSAVTVGGEAEPFVEVDGKDVTAEADFQDLTVDDGTVSESVPGSVEATCP